MNKIILIVLIILIIGTGGYYFWKNTYSTPSVPGSQPQSQQMQQTARTGEQSIAIKNFSFNPATLTVKKGAKITWTNEDSIGHTVTSNDNKFDSGTLNAGQSFSRVFDQVGTFDYHCSIHPAIMKGKIIVED